MSTNPYQKGFNCIGKHLPHKRAMTKMNNTNDNNNQNNQKSVSVKNVIESLNKAGKPTNTLKKGVGNIASETGGVLKQDLIKKMPKTFIDQLFGPRLKNYSGEIDPGGQIEMKKVFTGQQEKEEKLAKQLAFERQLRKEQQVIVEKKTNDLKLQLKAVMEEVVVLTEKTGDLGEQTKIAAMQAPVEPGVYHLVFFEKLLEFLKSFGKKIEEASLWLHSANKRASKRNKWGSNYKKHGAKYLLSGEHYVSRSAG